MATEPTASVELIGEVLEFRYNEAGADWKIVFSAFEELLGDPECNALLRKLDEPKSICRVVNFVMPGVVVPHALAVGGPFGPIVGGYTCEGGRWGHVIWYKGFNRLTHLVAAINMRGAAYVHGFIEATKGEAVPGARPPDATVH